MNFELNSLSSLVSQFGVIKASGQYTITINENTAPYKV